ncbi:hypothetical protein [Pseudonocardia sp. GCM10023141]|uniref:hypothetical protein n=1 Tax=Pseudonocardia sp. GCM10023141 TaxID=3252653 RepID=UPI00361DE731
MIRRVAPAVGLFLISPLMAEFLLGNLPITFLFALLFLAPMYGGGALLIREFARRTGRGMPTIVVLGVAYGIVEEGLVTQSLFNPNYAGVHLLSSGFIPALGIAAPWTVFVLTLHAIGSITAPIVVAESLVPDRRTTPWLGRVGLAVTAVLFVFGLVADTVITLRMDPTISPAPQLIVAAVVAVLVAVAAFRLPRSGPVRDGWVPSPLILLVLALVLGVVFEFAGGWAGVVLLIVLAAAASTAIVTWAGRSAWSGLHTLALAGGAVLTYAWHAFPETTVIPVSPTVDLVGNIVFGAAAVTLLGFAAYRSAQEIRHPHPIGAARG